MKKVLLKAKQNWLRILLISVSFSGLTLIAGVFGLLLALSQSAYPLLKRPLRTTEAAVFTQGDFTDRHWLLPTLDRPITILVMGMSVLTSDVGNPPPSSEDLGYLAQVNKFEGLADVMLLVRVDPTTGELIVLSIPRDTRIITRERGVTKINATNVIGGPAKSASVVSDLLLDSPIDRYVRVNVLGVERLVDALGGVTVDVPADLKYTDESQHLYIDLKAGEQHLNGEETLQLLRFRQDGQGDIGRIGRQRLVLEELMRQKLNPLLLPRLPLVLSVIVSHLDSNLRGDEIVALGAFLMSLERDTIEWLMLPGEANGTGRYGTSYWLPDDTEIRQIVRRYFASP